MSDLYEKVIPIPTSYSMYLIVNVEWYYILNLKKQNIWENYLKTVLYQGGSKNMGKLFFNILGREPRYEALLELRGV